MVRASLPRGSRFRPSDFLAKACSPLRGFTLPWLKTVCFFASLAKLNRARVPAFAIALQGAVAILITFSGRYEQILNYVVSVDVIFFALTAGCVFVFRHRRKTDSPPPAASPMPVQLAPPFRVPGHPVTSLFFILACCAR